MPPTWSLDVDDTFDLGEGPNSRWCSLRRPGGFFLPVSVEGPASEWLELAGAIAERRPLAFKRAAFTPTAGGGGDFHSPKNAASDRPSASLTAPELEDLLRSIRDQLAPAPAPGYRCTTCGDLGYVLGGVGNAPDEQAEDPCPDCPRPTATSSPTASPVPAPGSRPPGVPTSAPIADQPPPVPSDRPAIWPLVIADMRERDQLGRQRYGTPLQAFNGRDPVVDAYQEALDLAVYLRQAIEERQAPALPADLHRLLVEHAEAEGAFAVAARRHVSVDEDSDLANEEYRAICAEVAAAEDRRHATSLALAAWTRTHLLPRTETP